MRKIYGLMFVVIVLMQLACARQDSAIVNENLSVSEARQLIEKSKNDTNFVLLDVRTPQEYEAGHIAGAKLLNFRSPDFEEQVKNLPKNKSYLLYCRTGHRSGMAKEIFKKYGLKVQHMVGGITAWKEKGLPVTNE